MADIFISYKKERRAHAERLAAILEAHGYEVWWDYELAVGPDFRDQIETKLELSKIVIVLWCSGAVRSRFVRSEANRADKRGKLIQAYLEWVEPPLGFEEAQGQPLVNWTGEAEGEVLAGLLAALADKLGERRRADNIIRLIANLPELPQLRPLDIQPDDVADEPAASLPPTDQQIAPYTRTSPSRARWALIEKSLDLRDYEDFLEVFPSVPEAFNARMHKRQLEDWARVDSSESKRISDFLTDGNKGAKLFEALDHHVHSALQQVTMAELEAKKERAAAQRAKDEHEAREREWRERLGPKVVSAVLAARAGKPIAERMFKLNLPDTLFWKAPDIVVIPPGRFLMGAPEGEEGATEDEFPQHEVVIDYAFALGQCTVTYEEFEAYRFHTRSKAAYHQGCVAELEPVVDIAWADAQAFIAWQNERQGLTGRADAWRLPSEAEWEYACRAGTTTPFHYGKTISPAHANYDAKYTYAGGPKGRARDRVVGVGSYPANPFGLHDMHGNVWEWCADPWHENYSGAPSDGSVWDEGGDSDMRVLRGGSFDSAPQGLRSASRHALWTMFGVGNGFRLARTL